MGVGFPATLYLHEFGSKVWDAFGTTFPPYHVGSSLELKSGWRDVDVRLILTDEEWDMMFPNLEPDKVQTNAKWASLCMAFSCFGKELTGLPIDFQIQKQDHANRAEGHGEFKKRSALGLVPHRYR